MGLYEEISERHHCFELEYNLGNAHYKLDNVGEAILHYERAKMIDPLNDDLRANMLLADLRAIDKIEELPGAGLDKILQVVFAGKLFSVWFLLGLGLWTIGFVLIAAPQVERFAPCAICSRRCSDINCVEPSSSALH